MPQASRLSLLICQGHALVPASAEDLPKQPGEQHQQFFDPVYAGLQEQEILKVATPESARRCGNDSYRRRLRNTNARLR
jgi:hypothetical protein